MISPHILKVISLENKNDAFEVLKNFAKYSRRDWSYLESRIQTSWYEFENKSFEDFSNENGIRNNFFCT